MTRHGFEVVVVQSAGDTSPGSLSAAAGQHRAVASVAFARTRGHATADIWISDRVTGKTSVRTISTPADGEAPSRLALRAVELLRASLREFAWTSAPPADIVGAEPARAPPELRRWAGSTQQQPDAASDRSREAHRAAWWLQVDAAALHALREASVAVGPAISVGHRPVERLGARLHLAGPLVGTRLTSEAATADVRYLLGLLAADYALLSTESFALALAAAAGGAHLEVRGEAAGPWVGHSASRWVGAGSAGVGATWAVWGPLGLRFASDCVWLMPRPVVQLAGRQFRLGNPWLLLGGGVVVGL
jgi:hypothetical protein